MSNASSSGLKRPNTESKPQMSMKKQKKEENPALNELNCLLADWLNRNPNFPKEDPALQSELGDEDVDGIQNSDDGFDDDGTTISSQNMLERVMQMMTKPDAVMKKHTCSALSEDELKTMGIMNAETELKIHLKKVDELVETCISKWEVREQEWEVTFEYLRLMVSHFNLYSEAGARAIINVFLVTAVDIYERTKVPNGFVLIHPEIALHQHNLVKSKIPNHTYNSKKFQITGVTDFILAVMSAKRGIRGGEAIEPGALFRHLGEAELCCVVVEAKRGVDGDQNVPLAKPEAVGQALLFAKRTDKQVVRWIVTNAKVWSFGFLRKGLGENEEKWFYHEAFNQRIAFGNFPTKNDSQYKDTLEEMKTIIVLVMEWCWPTVQDCAFDVDETKYSKEVLSI